MFGPREVLALVAAAVICLTISVVTLGGFDTSILCLTAIAGYAGLKGE